MTEQVALNDMPSKGVIARRIATHSLILLLVTCLPPLIYEAVDRSRWRDIDGIAFAGGVTYPAYACYWILKIGNARARFILLYLLSLLTISCLATGLWPHNPPVPVLVLPAIVGALPLFGALYLRAVGEQHAAKTCLLSAVVSLPVGVAFSTVIIFGAAMSTAGFRSGGARPSDSQVGSPVPIPTDVLTELT
jgi:hypothetical protein